MDTNAFFATWFAAQAELHTWSAGFTQTRNLKALAQPLLATGQVWVAMPERFRWELGVPAQTIALRRPDELLVIYPRLKRAESYPLGAMKNGPWRDALALLDAGFPKSRADLDASFQLKSLVETNGGFELSLQPKSATAKRFMSEIRLGFQAKPFSLTSTEMRFSDGSKLRNDFTQPRINPIIDTNVFEPRLGPDIKIVEPLKQ